VRFDSSGIRREFFKFFYHQGLFELNKKGDAAEALTYLLNFMHYDLAPKPQVGYKAPEGTEATTPV
jgi:hypothetical protein